jgi:glycosyltransferase involved in cell wall biosynthesis
MLDADAMFEGSRIVVVVPACEEAPRIARVLDGIPAFVDHVVVVDDASTDGTSAVARESGGARTLVVRHPENRGVGAAIATGYARALALTAQPHDAVAVMAGDGQMHPGDLADVLLPVVRGQAHYAKGNRFAGPTLRTMPWPRRLGGRVLSHLTSWAIGSPIEDSQCGYTALARSALAALPVGELYPRFGYPNDLLGLLAARHATIVEVPIRAVYEGAPSRLKPWHVPRIAALVARAAVRTRASAAPPVPPLRPPQQAPAQAWD